MAQRTLRQRQRISYFEPEEPSLDEYVFCEKCGDYVYEYCSIHGALLVIPDDKVPSKPNFPSFVPRAALTIPRVFLHLNYSTIPGAGLGVFTTLTLPCGVRFGPYRGERTNDVTSDYSWQIYDRNRKPSHVVDASDKNKSNWMRYVNCARHWTEQNLVAFQYQGQLYYRTIKIIPRYTELMVFYGSEYANLLHIDLGKYNSPKGYAQKFGAPAPKKPKFGANKKLQEVALKPLEKINEKHNIMIPKAVIQEKAEIKVPTENKPQPRKGALAPKIRKMERKTPKQENLGPAKQNLESLLVGKNKKASKIIKTVLEQTTDTNKMNQVLTNTPDEIATNSKFDGEKGKNSCNTQTTTNTPENVCTVPLKTQNVGQTKPEAVYFICNVCNHQSVTKNCLEKHIKLHDVNRKFACETCTYRFFTSLELKKHNLLHHGIKSSDVKIHECNICDYTTVWELCLKRHLLKHAGLKPYSCSKCSFKSNRSDTLRSHLRTHTGEKPYSCSMCSYKSTTSENLRRHLKTHTDEKPYSCSMCSYKSIQGSDLKSHLRTHTGEKPFSCSMCSYRSATSGSLTR